VFEHTHENRDGTVDGLKPKQASQARLPARAVQGFIEEEEWNDDYVIDDAPRVAPKRQRHVHEDADGLDANEQAHAVEPGDQAEPQLGAVAGSRT
jgi:hypothetical protein